MFGLIPEEKAYVGSLKIPTWRRERTPTRP